MCPGAHCPVSLCLGSTPGEQRFEGQRLPLFCVFCRLVAEGVSTRLVFVSEKTLLGLRLGGGQPRAPKSPRRCSTAFKTEKNDARRRPMFKRNLFGHSSRRWVGIDKLVLFDRKVRPAMCIPGRTSSISSSSIFTTHVRAYSTRFGSSHQGVTSWDAPHWPSRNAWARQPPSPSTPSPNPGLGNASLHPAGQGVGGTAAGRGR